METLVNEVYHNRKVLITGHTGFKGGWLSLWLCRLGAKVTGYALKPPTRPSFFEACGLAGKMESVAGDVRDPAHLSRVIKKAEPEFIFHCAAQPLVRRSYREPVETFETNVMGTAYVLDAARRTRCVRAIVTVTSDKCYRAKKRGRGHREGDPLGGCDPYSASKACAEITAAAYAESFSLCSATARAGNVIGGGDWAEDRLVPDCIRALVEKCPVLIRYPAALRPWQHVLEPLYGYLLLGARLYAEGEKFTGAWNFGPEEARPVSWMVRRLLRAWGGGQWRTETKNQPAESQYLALDSAKSRARLLWRPVWKTGTAIEKTAEWYRKFYAGGDMYKFSLKQIEDYENKLKK